MHFGRTLLNSTRCAATSRRRRRARAEAGSRIVVLGGAGYLGSVLVRHLLHHGLSVCVLDALPFGSRSLTDLKADSAFALVEGDVRDLATVRSLMMNCDAVVHLAGIVGDTACDEQKELARDVNVAATGKLIDIARECHVPRFIFASSCSVYGASDTLLNESSPLRPFSIYAQSKVEAEAMLLDAQDAEFSPVSLRFGTLFGLSPRMRFDLVVNLFVAQAASSRRITVCNGEQWRPFLHVHDAARAIGACLNATPGAISGQIFNVGSPALNCQLGELGREVVNAIPGTRISAVENGDRRNYRVSFEKIQNVLGFRCEKSLAFGINEIYDALPSSQPVICGARQALLNPAQQVPS